jgi:hypothetical protein
MVTEMKNTENTLPAPDPRPYDMASKAIELAMRKDKAAYLALPDEHGNTKPPAKVTSSVTVETGRLPMLTANTAIYTTTAKEL